jgi:hypothetical protein
MRPYEIAILLFQRQGGTTKIADKSMEKIKQLTHFS